MRGRSQIILAVVAALVVCALFYFLFIGPRRSELSEVRAQIQTEQEETEALEIRLEQLRQLQDDAPQLQAEIDELREAVPERNELPNFIFQVQEAANRSGVGVVQLTPQLPKQPPEGAALAEVRIVIGVKGGYFAVQDFTRRLYELDRALRIDSLGLIGTEDEEEAREEGRVTLTATSRIFFELPAVQATATAPTTPPTTTTTPAAPATPAPTPTP